MHLLHPEYAVEKSSNNSGNNNEFFFKVLNKIRKINCVGEFVSGTSSPRLSSKKPKKPSVESTTYSNEYFLRLLHKPFNSISLRCLISTRLVFLLFKNTVDAHLSISTAHCMDMKTCERVEINFQSKKKYILIYLLLFISLNTNE